MSRANGTRVIFESDVDRRDYVKTLAGTCDKTGFQAHAFRRMGNHFHLGAQRLQMGTRGSSIAGGKKTGGQ
jgi:hypothetical protein